MLLHTPKNIALSENIISLPTPITASCDDRIFDGTVEIFSSLSERMLGASAKQTESEGFIKISAAELDAEEYSLEITEGSVIILASTRAGALYALGTLLTLAKKSGGNITLPVSKITDMPRCSVRGAHFYMPAREGIDEFKSLIDSMLLMKMNTLILEVGGGMQYDRHPEINIAWEKFCKTIDNMPGVDGSRSFQGSDLYWKDSLHTELAGGSYLTKDEVRDIVKYAKSRGMNVIPEIQALSHAYYLTFAHPEIAEMAFDPFPDTYCPSNEKSYELYFDVADEVIEVFEPNTVSIGHDEIRVLGWCDKCKSKTGHELVGGDVCRLHDFYASRGIRIAMWAESAQRFVSYRGSVIGEREEERIDTFGRYYKLPATSKSIEMLPSDILMLDWYHSAGYTSEDVFDERGFEVIYGNFHANLFSDFDKRSKKSCIRGAEVSSWCTPDEKTLADDGILFKLMFAASILWSDDYDNSKYNETIDRVRGFAHYVREIYGHRSVLRDADKLEEVFASRNGEENCIDLASADIADTCLKDKLKGFGKLSPRRIDEGVFIINKEFYADSLLFLHNAKKELPFLPSYFYRSENDLGLASYAVKYEDGDVECVNIYYGKQVGAESVSYARHRDGDVQGHEIDMEIANKGGTELPCYFTADHAHMESLTYHTTVIFDNGVALFGHEWINPHPDKKIVAIRPYTFRKDYSLYDSRADRSQAVSLYAILAASKG